MRIEPGDGVMGECKTEDSDESRDVAGERSGTASTL